MKIKKNSEIVVRIPNNFDSKDDIQQMLKIESGTVLIK